MDQHAASAREIHNGYAARAEAEPSYADACDAHKGKGFFLNFFVLFFASGMVSSIAGH